MSLLSRMYGSNKAAPSQKESSKNPNRVAGGMRAQGVDHFVVLGEDGREQHIPSQRYVKSLEDQLKKDRAAINVLERKLARQEAAIQAITTKLNERR